MEQTVNQRLKILRQHLGLNQEQLATAIGLVQATISSIEKGRQEVTPQNMELLSKKFNVSKSWLIEGNGGMFITDSNKKVATSEQQDWKEEAYANIKAERDRALSDASKLWALINHLTNGKITNFRNAPDLAGSLMYMGGQSGAQPAYS